MLPRGGDPARRIVVVGAGLAGLRAAEMLRGEGYDAGIVMIGKEAELPYDRPPLSKKLLTGPPDAEPTTLRSADELDALDIELRLGAPARNLDLVAQTVEVNGARLRFDGMVIATGARPRRLAHLPELEGVHELRTLADARALRAALEDRPRVIIVGAGFIGSEVAASARSLGLDVTLVEAAQAPMTRLLGEQLGGVCARLHREHGVELLCGVTVESVEGSGRVERVRLSDGRVLSADLIVAGVGVTPDTDWLAGSGLTIDDGVVCDRFLNAGHPAVFAAGDVARWPNELFMRPMRSEQWTNAVEQARRAARNLLAGPDGAEAFRGSNYAWSDQYGFRLQFVGSSDGATVHVVWGDLDEPRFVAWFRRDDRLVGAFGVGAARLLMQSKLMIEAATPFEAARARLKTLL